MSTSENLEMYLVTIALLEEQGVDMPVGLSRLADELRVQPVSANQMVRKLDEEGLVTYQPYKGVSLTSEGKQLSSQIIRHRRLWEVFFTQNLGVSPSEAESLACRIEHVSTKGIAARLFKFLGEPQLTQDGKVIPLDGEEGNLPRGSILTELHAGQKAEVTQILAEPSELTFLQTQGFSPGKQIQVIAASSSGAVLVDTGKNKLSLVAPLANKIRVHPMETSYADEQ